jgi:predicted AAA+ superfamily ATPase
MLELPKNQILERLHLENPWWATGKIESYYDVLTPRPYLGLLYPLLQKMDKIRRAVILLGPRRVGKTVIIHHCIRNLLAMGFPPRAIMYCSVDHPLYNGLSLDNLLNYFMEASGTKYLERPTYIFFDEIQYHRDWETHLKVIVDTYKHVRPVVSGSAAAALKLKSLESGAGRFTEFLLPPLTFHEYTVLLAADGQETPQVAKEDDSVSFYRAKDIEKFNEAFLSYLNFGGYPEVVLSSEIQSDPARFIKSDIIDKVLLRDLPSLYGIHDIQELNSLFTTLAYNTAHEVSLDGLSQNSGVAKNTIKKYIEYLTAAFLIRTVHRVDLAGRKFKRAHSFKVYLTNPSIRSALFSPVKPEDSAVGDLAETAVFAQWFHHHGPPPLYYARWDKGEVDLVNITGELRVCFATEVKWSDRCSEDYSELKNAITFCQQHHLKEIVVTTRSVRAETFYKDVKVEFIPVSEYCFTVGKNLVAGRAFITPFL